MLLFNLMICYGVLLWFMLVMNDVDDRIIGFSKVCIVVFLNFGKVLVYFLFFGFILYYYEFWVLEGIL